MKHQIKLRGCTALLLGFMHLLVWLIAPHAAFAHPSDAYLQASYITIRSSRIEIELNLTPGVLVAPQVLPELDKNNDQQISEAEGAAYVNDVLRNLAVQVDERALALDVSKIELPTYLNLQAGYGIIRVVASAEFDKNTSGAHQLLYQNNNAPAGVAYQVNALVSNDTSIALGQIIRDENQQRFSLAFTIGSGDTTSASIAPTIETTSQARQLLDYLQQPTLSVWVVLIGLGLATFLGGLHALTPGHGKTLVAAYLVGSRGTVRHAALLGATVTVTHTASVIVIGLLALFASQFIVPNVLIPILEITSGLLVVLIGARLIWQRWFALRTQQPSDHAHIGAHSHTFSHGHGDGRTHTHLHAHSSIKPGNLVVMGISGGLVPCPEALGIMVIAIGLNRALLGLGLIISFSFGLAAVLILIGILLVRSRVLFEKFGGLSKRWIKAVPLVSAVIVTVLGIGIALGGVVKII